MADEIQIDPEQIYIELAPDELLEFQNVLQYLVMKTQRKTNAEIATHFGCTPRTVMNWILKWRRSGLLEKGRKIFLVDYEEQVLASTDHVLETWPDIVERMLTIAKDSKREYVALQAAQWLFEKIVQPKLARQTEPGAAELEYVKGITAGHFDPTHVTEE